MHTHAAHRLITEWRIVRRVEEQFKSFMSGFNELIPQELINVFDERELELLIGGMSDGAFRLRLASVFAADGDVQST